MANFKATTIKVTSAGLRISALLYFRFFPAIFPKIILTLYAIYAVLAYHAWASGSELEVVDDKVDVTLTETVEPQTPLLTEDGVAVAPEPEVVKDEIEIEETIILEEKPARPWSTFLSGLPNSRNPIASISTILLNLLLAGLTVDSLYRARLLYPANDLSFARLGYVSPNEAKFIIREPDQAKMPVLIDVRIKDAYKPTDAFWWQTAGGVRWTSDDQDFTATLTVPLTHPMQRTYEWKTSNGHHGEFQAPPQPGHMSDFDDNKFTFLSTSCILPRFPYNPLDHALSIPGLRHLARKLPDLHAQFMLFLGDFIYVDVPQRFGKTKDEYRMQYRQIYASPDWPAVSQNLSWIHVLDDHEIANDWSSNTTGIYSSAVEPWHVYQANVNPPQATRAGSKQSRTNATWYEFTQGPASFFMMDTRSYRSSNSESFEDSEKTMLGQSQLEDLLSWLARPEPKGVRWKVVASSVPFTKNWPVNIQDTWGGFLVERKKVLEAMWDAGARGTGVVILSGDRHEFAATKFPPPPDSKWPESAAAHEFSTSPLNQFASPFGSYKQVDDEDIKLHYISSGNSKFGAFTFEKVAGQSSLLYRLFIDGEETWSTVVLAPPEVSSPGFFGFFKGG